ncbi:MAG: tyrosine-type recombinase/integrase [Thermoplasmatales archaeon]|nr:tyrosine-type recombinase/integrase [Thermoplasmatales archaeon]
MYYKGKKGKKSTKKSEKKPKTLPKYLTKTKVEEVLETAKSDNKRNFLILNTLWRTGMRNSELVKLKKKDIDTEDKRIFIHQGKGKKDRWIPLENTLGDLLTFYSSDMIREDTIFPLTTAQIRNIAKRYRGDNHMTPHTLRHSFAVYCLKNGMNIRNLQLILGHSDLATTAIYLDLIGEDVMADFQKVWGGE